MEVIFEFLRPKYVENIYICGQKKVVFKDFVKRTLFIGFLKDKTPLLGRPFFHGFKGVITGGGITGMIPPQAGQKLKIYIRVPPYDFSQNFFVKK